MGVKFHTHKWKQKKCLRIFYQDNLATKKSVTSVDQASWFSVDPAGGGTIVGSGSLTFYIGIHEYREKSLYKSSQKPIDHFKNFEELFLMC